MDMRYEWKMVGKHNEMHLCRVYRHQPTNREIHNVVAMTRPVKHTDGTTKWCVYGRPSTYHANKRGAMKMVTSDFMGRITMRGKIPDLTNAYWSTEMIGDHRFDVLRVQTNGEMHQVASIDERCNPTFWAAIRGMGQVPLDGAETYEEARAVCIALLRMR